MQNELTPARLRERLSYDPETGDFTWLNGQRAGQIAGTRGKGYRYIEIDDAPYTSHRLAWLYVHGEWPTGPIDHANRNKHDNRLSNLRLADKSLNSINRAPPANSSTGVAGVHQRKCNGRFFAYIGVKGKRVLLGDFERLEDAKIARRAAEREHFGEFAPTF